jgi:PAS domain S-box-containing protein
MTRLNELMQIKILLVEDNPADADLLQEFLVADSINIQWDITPVELRQDALQCLSEQDFDIVLLDLSLPDSQGLSTLTRLQEVAFETPMIVMTGLNDQALALEAVRLGAQDYLVKDQITPQLLVRSIQYAIGRSETLQLLRESQQRFQAIFNQTFQLTALLSPEGIVLELNQTALEFTETKLSDVVGFPFSQMRMWGLNPAVQEQLHKAIAAASQSEFVRYEVDVIGKANQVRTVDFSLKSLKDEAGKVILLIAEARDISDRKKAEVEILKALERERELSELRARFVSMVSHEFRTPLSTIALSIGLLEMYGEQWKAEKKQVHFYRIQTAIQRMTGLLEDILVIGKAEAGKLEFKPALINLRKFCEQLVEEIQITDGKFHQISWSYSCAGDEVKTDEKLLRQILGNLLSNAFKYSNKGTLIKFEVLDEIGEDHVNFHENPQNKSIVFKVQDQGIGIPKSEQEHIFQTFFRATNIGTVSGTGLGLAIVKRAVDLHGGKVFCESEENIGTTFTIILPCYCHREET